MESEGIFYTITAETGATLLRQVAQRVLDLCRTSDEDFSVFERAPELYCSGRREPYGARLLTFRQVPGFRDHDAYAAWVTAPTLSEWRARRKLLHALQKEVTVHLTLDRAPDASIPRRPKRILRAWRANERKRLDPQKSYPLPSSPEDWYPQVREQHARREAHWWRTICIAPRTYTKDDIFFLLALGLLQEQMLQEPDVESLHTTMTDYLRTAGVKGCADGGTARLVLDRLLRHFVEPEHKDGLCHYIKSFLSWTKHSLSGDAQMESSQIFHTLRAETVGNGVTVADALTRFKDEGLPATRSTLYRWAQEWSLKNPHLAFDDEHEQRWFTCEGFAEARLKLVCREISCSYRRVSGGLGRSQIQHGDLLPGTRRTSGKL